MIGILLVGYSRFEFILENLGELSKVRDDDVCLYISIDGPKETNKIKLRERRKFGKELTTLGLSSSSNLIFHKKNLGCDQHIPWAIEWSLKSCQSVIVIEDDVRISNYSLKKIIERLRVQGDDLSPVLGISCLHRPKFFPKLNVWRETPYFNAWGYGVSRNFWEQHKVVMQKLLDTEDLKKVLEDSRIWSRLSGRKRSIWRERFDRGNYDYRIQLSMFALNIKAISPIFRMIENIGHGWEGATHTKFKTPRYLRASTRNQSQIFISGTLGIFLSKCFIFLDSQTWAGDGLLNVRGRNIGLRSFARRYLSRGNNHENADFDTP